MGAKSFTASAVNLKPDPVYGSLVLSKFINCLMYDGKKATAQRVVYGAFTIIEKRNKDMKPIEVFDLAINNVKPAIETKSRRVGGQNYQVPMAVSRKRQQSLAFRWLLEAASRREGAAIQTRENVHKMAEANRAFAHFAW